jgi:murein DD-endopeptidase MepM/ murein hydrolase activator NlpD
MDRRLFLASSLAYALSGCAAAVAPRRRTFGAPVDPARDPRSPHRLVGQFDSGPLDERELQALFRDIGVTGRSARRPSGTSARRLDRWPLRTGLVTSEFGPRWGTLHQGIDIAGDAGVPVYAAAPGQVVHAGVLGTYGDLVVLRHDPRSTTLYAHNRALRVRVGESVRAGQVIALLGSTGRSSGPHVHFEVREGEQPVDPRHRLPAAIS